MERDKRGLIPGHPTSPPSLNLCNRHHDGSWVPKLPKRSCIVLVRELMDDCISICMVTKSSIRRLSRLIPSVEFSPTNSPEDEPNSLSIPTLSSKFTSYTRVWQNSYWWRDSYFSISLVLRMEMSSPSMAIGTSSCAREQIDPPGLVRWRHEGRRPCEVLWSITGAWARVSVGRTRREHSLHSPYQFLHPT
jgi:hypothetical protein